LNWTELSPGTNRTWKWMRIELNWTEERKKGVLLFFLLNFFVTILFGEKKRREKQKLRRAYTSPPGWEAQCEVSCFITTNKSTKKSIGYPLLVFNTKFYSQTKCQTDTGKKVMDSGTWVCMYVCFNLCFYYLFVFSFSHICRSNQHWSASLQYKSFCRFKAQPWMMIQTRVWEKCLKKAGWNHIDPTPIDFCGSVLFPLSKKPRGTRKNNWLVNSCLFPGSFSPVGRARFHNMYIYIEREK